ncbi:hypothetical protein SK128_020404, partial [Halocaridina rubra]
KPWNGYFLQQCGKACYETVNCSSILVRPATGQCSLLWLNRCLEPTVPLLNLPGYHFYELLDGSGDSKTCFDTCIETSSCFSCGIHGCRGPLCDDCAQYCWEMSQYISSMVALRRPAGPYNVHCFFQKQLMLRSLENLDDTPDFPLEFEIHIQPKDFHKKVAIFDSVQVKNKLLTIGNFVSGAAGNFWQAPFVNRSLVHFPNSSCLPFYYPPISNCSANGLSNINTSKKLYAWITGDAVFDSKELPNIFFWM